MNSRIRSVVGLLVLGLAGSASLGGDANSTGPAAINLSVVREKVSPGTCQVTVLNGWGVPVAYANGFLLGQGRFVLTDLGAVGQPGASSVSFKFASGPSATAKEFGLADTATGLVALRVEAETPSRGGLELAAEAPSLDAAPMAAAVGWPWCGDVGAASGRLVRGPLVKDLAQRCGITPPEAAEAFLRMEGVRLDAASGAPVVNAQGTVVAVKIDLAAKGMAVSLAVSAAPFRTTLLAATPQLKSLSELPKPVWPVRLLRLPGEPPAPAEFTKATLAVRTGMVCPTCNGKPRKEGMRGGPPGWGCPMCGGDGVAFTPALKALVSNVAIEGTRVVWAPVAEDQTRAAVRTASRDLLKTLTQAPQGFQTALAGGFWSDAATWHASTFPRGTLFYGEVHETIEGPDGKYVCLGVENAKAVVALRVDLLAEAAGKTAASKEWTAGTQVALLGTAMGRFKLPSGEQGIYVLPFDWLPTPGFTVTMPGDRRGPPPPDPRDRQDRPGPADRTDRPPAQVPGAGGLGR